MDMLKGLTCAPSMTTIPRISLKSHCSRSFYQLLLLLLACYGIFADKPSMTARVNHRSPWKHEIISPNRLSNRGTPIHKSRHFQKRSLSYLESKDGGGSSFHQPGEPVFYSIDAFGEQFHISLEIDHTFISPSFRLDVNSHDRLNSSAFESLRHCFFSGLVNDHHRSYAVFSLCGGLYGIFQTSNGSQYLIEPLKGHKDQHVSEQPLQKDHIISTHNDNYKPPTQSKENGGTCGTKSEDAGGEFSSRSSSFSSQLNSIADHLNKNIKASKTERTDDSNKAKSRRKRFKSYEHFLELMVVADSKMVDHHGDNVQHYILTLISMVDRIFRDRTIGNSINLVLVQRVILLPKSEPGLDITSSSTSTLRSFCAWQKRQNEPNGHPHHYDTAILLTRENICRSDTACDTLGLAELGTICDPDRSCSIVEDNGLSAAFTMAHEMGHVFNLPHDDAIKCEQYFSGSYHVMAPTLNHSSKPWSWSNCSRHFLTSFLEAGHGHCLWNKPNDTQVLPSYLPGEVYNTSKQCEIVFGENSRLCPFTDYKYCSLLWCTASRPRDSTGAGCYTHQMPQADGTPCELNKWCIKRECVPRTPNAVEIHGGWGTWLSYGSCSRTCGGGVQQSKRECNNPEPENGGKYCIGDRVRFRSCAFEPCPEGSRDFREDQCASYNSEDTEWVAKFSGVHDNDVCKLFCQKKYNPTSFQRKSKQVIDGTPCKRSGDDICVQGQCKRAGCDHRLGSDTVRDNCHVCGGDNSTCSLHRGHYNQQKWGYNAVITIPVDATMFVVTQTSYNDYPSDDNFLALRAVDDTYYLNGNFVVSTSLRQIKMAGVVMTYSGSDQIVESIFSQGKFNQTVYVEVLSVGTTINRPNISYGFYYPIEGSAVFDWDNLGPWGRCSHTCEGRKHRSLRCVRRGDNTEVSNGRCTGPPPARISKKCNNKCVVRWEDHAYTECSSRCGHGLQQFDVRCYKVMKKTGRKKIESDSRCDASTKPARIRHCNGSCPIARWEYSEWTSCSRPCSNGTRVRDAFCRDATGRQLNDSKCTEPKRVRELCNMNPCPQWRVSAYSSCSVTCGRGEMVRSVMCYQDELRVSNDQCLMSLKPDHIRPCEISRCPTWQHGSWSECSVTCGRGVKVRSARCFQDGVHTSTDNCNPATMPVDEQSCALPPCSGSNIISLGARTFSGQWRMGSWTECSTTCGPGIKERYVSCSNLEGDPTDASHCDPVLRPSSREICEIRPCTHWESGTWQDCSRTCGKGIQQRHVNCRHEDGQYLDEEQCSLEEKPQNTQTCKFRSCRKKQRRWKKQKWSECSVLCGLGVKNRSVTCLDEYHDVMPDSECPEPKPKAVRKCARAPCAKWVAGSWSQCSVTCGKGQMFRPVLCVGDGQIMEDGVCRVRRSNKPPSVKRCTVGECPRFKWYKDEWGECSQTCGGGERFRDILCQDRDSNEFIEESYCSNRRKPHASMGCNKDPCHRQRARWNSGQWSECSRTCNAGIQVRQVICQAVSEEGWLIPGEADICDESIKPRLEQTCNLGGCEDDAAWVTGAWSLCSATCGLGTQIRQVECQDRYGSRTSEDSCRVPAIKPITTRDCTLRACQQSSCKDLQHLGNISEDGEYRLLIKGQFINIFCHQMSSTNPQEFLTLPQDIENFSEIYSKRLLAPLQCPYKGRRNDSCACTNAGHQEAGLTTFSKVRLNITTLEIITTDSTFARVRNGVFVPFATAGDCYSAEDCPQGNFRINLRDTGFTISSEAEWTTQGYAVSKTIDTSESNQLIRGHCGGYCGVCLPSRLKGRVLPLDVL